MSYATNPQGAARPNWQDELRGYCRSSKLASPTFHLVSDRRGGRTAWSSTVKIGEDNFAARYWYDGEFLNNAREDVAEVALKSLKSQQSGSSTVYQGQLWIQEPQTAGYGRGAGF